ncbi:4Fe-4S dicluster domain-containing protein [Thermocrinis sp.]|jgi:ferredoxin|uniref:4Fe-4S dicluster domain-containing protein n=1 Tax=Thermocrinis sp. TaxID=2024383 RepID=UPI003C06EE9C
MAMYINQEMCISCYACEQECPTKAIKFSNGKFEIDPRLCVECEGFYEEQQCVAICPIDGCILKLEELQ